VPVQDPKANAFKAKVDQGARDLLQPDSSALRSTAARAAKLLRAEKAHLRIAVLGGAGSGKSTFSRLLSKELGIPVFDLDQFIPEGWTKDKKIYDERFSKGLENLWPEVPVQKEWIIEHVRAADPELLESYKPSFVILVEQPLHKVLTTAEARDVAAQDLGAKSSVGSRQMRALQSREEAHRMFNRTRGFLLRQVESFWKAKLLD
jgi:hypothetical protein